MLNDKKSFRLLVLFDRLCRNEVIDRKNASTEFLVSEKTIERDIRDLNYYLENNLFSETKIEFSKKHNGYRLKNQLETKLNKEETLSLLKVILESRAFSKPDMNVIFDKLINNLSIEDKKLLNSFYGNEKLHYIETKNSKSLFQIMWDMSVAISEKRIVNAVYKKITDSSAKDIEIQPVSILFSEYYFYLLAYYHNKEYKNPAVFRLDNFDSYNLNDINFKRSYSIKDRFEEGEFRKRVQFMNIGDLMTITFEFWGRSLDAVTDRLPTARIIGSDGDRTILQAEVYGNGIKMWLLSQGEFLKVTKPQSFVDDMKQTISAMLENYMQ